MSLHDPANLYILFEKTIFPIYSYLTSEEFSSSRQDMIRMDKFYLIQIYSEHGLILYGYILNSDMWQVFEL